MPDIKHYFRAGRMNKDLDERLVPNGEYRDAQNIEISTSEGDDVGTVQNVRGTTRKIGKTYNSSSQTVTANWSGTSFGLTNAVCIGSKLNNENDRIYWFITSDEADCIAEYDDIKGIISPVLVDASNILNWTSTDYITGINVVEGMLLWTDNKTEPKKIDIEAFKSGCAGNFTTHTKYTGKKIPASELSAASNFTEQNITVAKKAPITAPTLAMSTSTRGGNGTGVNKVLVSNATASMFTDAENVAKDAGTSVTLNFNPEPNFQVGDIITLTSTYEELGQTTNYEIKLRITSQSNGTATNVCIIQSIPEEIPYVNLVWEGILSEEGVLFEKKFVRFAYRWKYTSGEYSTFSPFSEIAFKPDDFEYLSTDGHNVGMINNLRQLTITITDTKPVDVDEVDILYKESNNNNVYVVDTLKENSDGSFPTTYDLESEIISKTVESNQMIRPWDNVPRRAKAQEVTANRLIYGNYLQNYNIPNINMPNISMAILQSPVATVKTPELSVKSLRTYQAGVVYLDQYNRQTPVFTNSSASKQASKTYAETANSIQLTLNNTPPDWATHFKYYIKETSNEYYNLSMDRYYLAEDGNVWLSFPSSERNKVDEETYLILKKQHDADTFVGVKARYKILDISNEAPDFIKLVKKATATADVKAMAANRPQIGSTSFKFFGPNPDSNPSFGSGFSSDGLIQIKVGSQKTEKYNIVSGGPTGEDNGTGTLKYDYTVSIDEPLKEGETMLAGLSEGSEFEVILFEEKFERKPEFYGRFFVKINRDSTFDSNIIETYPDVQSEYGISNTRVIYDDSQNSGPNDGDQEASWKDTKNKHNKVYSPGHPVVGSHNMTIHWSGAPKSNSKSFDKANTINNFLKSMSDVGTLFRMKGSTSGTTGEIYKVTNCNITYTLRREGRPRLMSSKRRSYAIEFEHVDHGTPYEDSFTYSSDKIDEIQIVEKVISGDNKILTSNNPAIWETEPKEAVDLDLYYETGNTYAISAHGATHIVPFKNCYSFGNGVESNRIRDDYNAPQIDKGVKVSTVLAEQYKEERRKNGLIYSGLFNSTSGVNRLNQFIAGESITKDINPHYGSIQKLHARNTDLITFCEDKVLKILANKDALYEASGNPQLTATNRVLGQAIPYLGEYGISKNPESFASYAYRVYFADKNRGAILRLSRDGITPISDNGMKDYFKDTLPNSTLILGSYDDSKGLYNLTLDGQTVSFDEKVNGFPSFKSFIPEAALSLNNKYYSIKNGDIWVHTNEKRNRFYDTSADEDDATKYYNSSVTLLINEMPEMIKGFKTLNYGGSKSRVYTNNYDAGNNYNNPTSTNTTGWFCESITTNEQSGFIKEFKKKEGRYYNHIKGDATTLSNLDSQEFSVQGIGQYTLMTGDTTPNDRTVTVSLTGIANATVENYSFEVTPTTEIHSTNASIQMTIIPNPGSTVTAGDLSVVEANNTSMITEYVTSVTFAQSGANVIATVNFTDGVNMPNSDLSIPLAVTGDGALAVYKLHDLTLKHNTDSNITVTKSYSGSSNATAEPHTDRTGFPSNYAATHTVATITFDLASGYDFKEAPSFVIETQDDDDESEYIITYQDYNLAGSAITIGQGGNTLVTVDKRIYTIQYKFGASDTRDNVIIFDAISASEDVTEANKITGYNVDGKSRVSRFAQDKNVTVYGKVGANFTFKNSTSSTASTSGSSTTLTLSAANNDIRLGMLVTGSGVSGTVTVSNVSGTTVTLSSAQNISSTTITFSEWWNDSAWVSTETTLTIGSSGSYVVPLQFFETSVLKSYYITLAGVSPTTLLSPLMGNIYDNSGNVTNPFRIYQYPDATLTINAASASSDFTITSSNITSTYIALGYPVEDSSFFAVPLSITATATANITKDRDPEIEDFTNYDSNSFDWDFVLADTDPIVINNSASPKTVTITGHAYVDQYGTEATTSTLALDNFLSKAGGGSSSGGQIMWIASATGSGGFINIAKASYNDGTYSRTNSKLVDVGTANDTAVTGTGTIYGNFYGNSQSQITLSITPGPGNTDSGTACIDGLSITKGTLSGSGASQELTYTWSGDFDEQITSTSKAEINVQVSLFNEP